MSQTIGNTKLCPDCAEDVKFGARVCRFCGHNFDRDLVVVGSRTEPAEREQPSEREETDGGIAGGVIISTVLLFIAWDIMNTAWLDDATWFAVLGQVLRLVFGGIFLWFAFGATEGSSVPLTRGDKVASGICGVLLALSFLGHMFG